VRDLLFPAATPALSYLRAAKNACNFPAHSSANTPGVTSTR